MANFNISDALTLVCVVDEGSFAAAAKKAGVSSSVISKRISRLESQLRIQLIQRTTRSLALTESGKIFYERCQKIKTEISEATAEVLQHHQTPSGLLRINVPMSFGQVHLVPAVNDFLELYPEIQIELILGSQYASFIHNGLDVAIFIKDLPNTHLLKSRKITVRSKGVYGAPSYFKRFGLPKIPGDLVNHNCLIYQAEPGNQLGIGQRFEWHFCHEQKTIIVPVAGNLRINSSQGLVTAALAGNGVAKLSSFMVTEEIKNGSLVSVLEDYCERDIDIHAVYPNQQFLPSKVRVFIDFLIERFQSENYWHNSRA
ncbi:LysR family transcriptional regulator [Legionella drancourtii]|uniref:Putative LysR family transcriptional regulator n=1 Tax=Legionella drancourtii LLAP12 TaxID=658187 RepID=G9EPM1_9GAMM|nr:LysR family transcriptional regulator [Legionella drancourtii]EHL30794.1 putative LysR family transcriptional regulator [Legionella drancourtii LLAP12]